ncbi:MAG: hypothetical protein EZS28_053519, partial [Streblomastix strix]
FMPFVCRVKPVTDEDMYDVDSHDRCDVTTFKTDEGWAPRYIRYVIEKAEYDQLKAENPDAQIKPPKTPSLMAVLFFNLGSWQLIFSIIIMILSTGFQICQPSLMKEVLKQVLLKGMAPEMNPVLPPEEQIVYKFPYVQAIILMACPLLHGILDTLGNRLIFHFSSHLRSGLAGLIYKKTLLLNITAQSNIDTGRLLSLLSADTNQIAMMFP